MNALHYAVVVGINRYPYDKLGNLTGARADAEQFRDWLVADDGGELPPGNVELVTVTKLEEQAFKRPRGAEPTFLDVENALLAVTDAVRDALERDAGAWKQTRLYLYVAGHGFAPRGGRGALYLANAEERAGRNIELDQYKDWLERCGLFREIVVLADCCRDVAVSTARAFGPGMDDCDTPFNNGRTLRVLGYGAARGRPTYEERNEARGYFTTALLEGLRGSAPRDETGAITSETLKGYVEATVAELTKNAPYPQEADIELNGPIVFRPGAPSGATRTVEITFPAGFFGDVVLRRGTTEIDTWNAGKGPWPVKLVDALYEVAPAEGVIEFEDEGLFKVAGKDRRVDL